MLRVQADHVNTVQNLRERLGRRRVADDGAALGLTVRFSARTLLVRWQVIGFIVSLLAVSAGFLAAPAATLDVILAILAVPFLCVVLLRSFAIAFAWTLQDRKRPDYQLLPDDALPTYAVLVPLYKESEILPDLIAALSEIDYPKSKLNIRLICESSDPETLAALCDRVLPSHMHVHIVATSSPQTKPHALNKVLPGIQDDVVVVFDAEDMPEPDQLRRASAILAMHSECGCVQACLNVYNRDESFLTRQFTIEYTVLFDCLLPALRKLGLPIPLGGTSNHFPRNVLTELGGWDAFNVTEDADLGICLARAGYTVEMLDSNTWEEAPNSLDNWFKQRTRWLKGWMQTYSVHMREPLQLWSELGGRGFLGLHVLMGGILLSALVHPWVYILAAADYFSAGFNFPGVAAGTGVWVWLSLFNLIAGYVAGIALGLVAVRKRGWHSLSWHSFLMPAYWLLISCAAYRAVFQLISAPHFWEKTMHRRRQGIGNAVQN